jgi:catechol 2,3-dioxygenase-like lactoylglutathione lyase family enzyme
MSTNTSLSTISPPVPELPVDNVERSQRHYRDVLGFEIGWVSPDGKLGAVSRGPVAVFFRKAAATVTPTIHWIFAMDVDATYRELKASGAVIVDHLERKPWGLRQFTVADQDGHLFHFHDDT